MLRHSLIAVFGALLFTACASSHVVDREKVFDTTTPAARTGWHMQRHAQQMRFADWGNWRMVFLGDSITQSWEGAGQKVWAEHYEERDALNLGISGDRTQHVLWRLQQGVLDGLHPQLAVLMIGTNNSGSDTSEAIAAGVLAVVDELRTRQPDMVVLVLAIFPRGRDAGDRLRQVNEGANDLIEAQLERDADPKVHWLDIGPAFLAEETLLPREIMPDLLHLSPEGYRRWAEAIEPVVSIFVEE